MLALSAAGGRPQRVIGNVDINISQRERMLSARCQSISHMKVKLISRVNNKRTIDKGSCKSLLVKLRLTTHLV